MQLEAYETYLSTLVLPVHRIESPVSWQMLRLDLLDEVFSGNKLFKLLPYLLQAKQEKKSHIISFGGRHSNHLHALAHSAKRFGFTAVAIVRGYAEQAPTPTLLDLQALGVEIHFVGHGEYRRRYAADYQAAWQTRYPNSLVINEGGAGECARQGVQLMARVIRNSVAEMPDWIVCASGTGTTFMGLLASPLLRDAMIAAVPALNNAAEIEQLALHTAPRPYYIFDGFQCGGFARVNKSLAQFILAFEEKNHVPLDAVYTAKMCMAIEQAVCRGIIQPHQRILSLHTGGLQGMRAYREKIEALAH